MKISARRQGRTRGGTRYCRSQHLTLTGRTVAVASVYALVQQVLESNVLLNEGTRISHIPYTFVIDYCDELEPLHIERAGECEKMFLVNPLYYEERSLTRVDSCRPVHVRTNFYAVPNAITRHDASLALIYKYRLVPK